MGPKEELKNLISKYDLKPNKLLGQNFLIDQNILKKIVSAADLSKNDTVLEIGPGLGILTEALAAKAGKVIAVEKDKKMAEIVRNVLADRNIRNVEIIEGDILKFPVHQFPLYKGEDEGDFRKDNQILPNPPLKKEGIIRYKVVANIPYYLTARLIRKLLESENPPNAMVLMLQKEVAQRICAQPPDMSLLAVSVQFYARPKIISYVSKNSFWPAPKVDSAILKISRINTNDARMIRITNEQFFRVIRAGFAHPRKQLVNNLASGLKITRTEIEAVLKKVGAKPQQRAETLCVEDWIKLTELLSLAP
jgi:16S rRNA (adenine1518-N6/adenine1519-N6)-dimethyltransferase